MPSREEKLANIEKQLRQNYEKIAKIKFANLRLFETQARLLEPKQVIVMAITDEQKIQQSKKDKESFRKAFNNSDLSDPSLSDGSHLFD